MLKIRDPIEYAVDINPSKQNNFIAGTGQQIVSPEFLLNYQPDIVIVMNQIYKNEIQQTLNKLGLDSIIFYA
jgi:ABC-type Fe3+-hydroxamate transport system substrate-binding protein